MKSLKLLSMITLFACFSSFVNAQEGRVNRNLNEEPKPQINQNQPNQNQPRVERQNEPGTRVDRNMNNDRMEQNTDHVIATCLTIDNNAEIKMAQYAQSQTKNAEIRDFTEMLVKDHRQFIEKLERFNSKEHNNQAGQNNSSTSTQDAAPSNISGGINNDKTQINGTIVTDGDRADRKSRKDTKETSYRAGGLNPIQLHREMADQCYEDSVEMLKEKQDKFEECFVGMQIAGHAHMMSKLKVLKNHASGELAQVLEDGLKTTKEHKEHAEKLMEQLAHADKNQSRK